MQQQIGKYQLIRKLATGGMAEVYLAKSSGPLGFEKMLVLKRILPRLADESDFIAMFLSEAKLAARLTHSHIAQIFDFGEVDGSYFIAMEYINGPSVGALIKKAVRTDQPLPPILCARIIADACEGLAFAHDFADPLTRRPLHLIHRDVSPDNLLLSRQGEVKVVDFGIAKAAGQSHQTRAGIVRGKLSYMAPEQIRGDPLDRRADVYALGVVLYELLTGHRPYDTRSKSQADAMRARLETNPVPAITHRPDLPEPLRRILDQALADDVDLRYQDCARFQADLEEFIVEAGKPVTSQHVAQLITQLETLPDLPELPALDVPAPPPPKPAVPGPAVRPGPPSTSAQAMAQEEELPVLTALTLSIHKRSPPAPPPFPPAARHSPIDDDGAPDADRTMEAPITADWEQQGAGASADPLPRPDITSSHRVDTAAPAPSGSPDTKRGEGIPAKRGIRPWVVVMAVGVAAVLVLAGVELLLWWATVE